ncbi:MAG: hypothetical protein AAGU19_08135 [Prolixibacteraceae bacterium]
MENFNHIFVILWMLFGLYSLVLIAIMADLWSGVRKAKSLGKARTSYGFKRTVDKIARYYNTLIALSVVDTMQMGGVWYLDGFYGYSIPILPIITLVGAIGIGLIEIKSIYEKAEDKVQMESIGKMAGRIIANKEDLVEVAKAIADFMQENHKAKTDTNG